jgi:hypothetical protein
MSYPASVIDWASDEAFTEGVEAGLPPTLFLSAAEISQGVRPGKFVARKFNWVIQELTRWINSIRNTTIAQTGQIESLVPQIQIFPAMATWTKPNGAVIVGGVLVGGGGGGDACQATPSGGGAAGEVTQFILQAADMPASLTTTIGAGGAGGVGVVGTGGMGGTTKIGDGYAFEMAARGGAPGYIIVGGENYNSNWRVAKPIAFAAGGGVTRRAIGQSGDGRPGEPGIGAMGGFGGGVRASGQPGEGGKAGAGWGAGGGGAGGSAVVRDTSEGGRGGGGGGGGYGICTGTPADDGSFGFDGATSTTTGGQGAQGIVILCSWCYVPPGP